MLFRETAGQASVFIALFLAGAAASLLCDALRWPVRGAGRAARWIMDVFIACLSALLCFVALYETNEGTLRAYMAAAFLLGAAAYRLGLRRLMRFIINRIGAKGKRAPGGEPKEE